MLPRPTAIWEVVQWMHKYRRESCCLTDATKRDAANDHPEVVQWLTSTS